MNPQFMVLTSLESGSKILISLNYLVSAVPRVSGTSVYVRDGNNPYIVRETVQEIQDFIDRELY